LSDDVGGERSLLVVCSAFRGRKEGYANLTVKKIPKAVLSRCEWGKDDYSLEIKNLPTKPPEPDEPEELKGAADRKPRSKNERRAQATLFDVEDLKGVKR
jgi:adenine-specific DNA-methyltransferase